MDAVTLLKQNLDVERVLSHYDVEYKYFGDYIRCPCPIHKGDNPTAFVVSQDFLWVCHTNGDCGKGDVFTFIEKMEELEFPHDFPLAVNKLAEILGIDISNLEILERKNDYVKDVEKFLKYMKSKKKEKREFEKYELDAESKQVKVFRNFKEETLIHFGLQYIKEITLDKKSGEGQFTLYERVGIPIKKDEEIIGYSLRKIRAKDNPKWFHIPHKIETGELLYNFDACKEYDSIVVVEGIFDVWAFYEIGIKNVVCTFGAHLTDEQYRMLLISGKDVIWCYDNDGAGNVAFEKAKALMRYKVNQWHIKLPEGSDPCDCMEGKLIELYEHRERII